MSRKKSRTENRIGIPKSTVPRVHTTIERPKTKSGNKPGSRQRLAEEILAAAKKKSTDPRAGSKKPIDLSKYAKNKDGNAHGKSTLSTQDNTPVKYKTPQAELAAIEADEQLEALLEKREEGTLTSTERDYVEKMTARYKVLCELTGVDVDGYTSQTFDETDTEDDPFAKLDAIKMDDYKD